MLEIILATVLGKILFIVLGSVFVICATIGMMAGGYDA